MDTLTYLREYFASHSGFLTSLYDGETIRLYMPIYSASLAGICLNLDRSWPQKHPGFNRERTLLFWVGNQLSALNIAYWVILFAYSLVTVFITFGTPISENLSTVGIVKYGQIMQILFEAFKLPVICVIAYFFCRIGFLPALFLVLGLWCMWEITFIFQTALVAITGMGVLALLIAPLSLLLWWLWSVSRSNGKK